MKAKLFLLALVLGFLTFSAPSGFSQNDQKERAGVGLAPPPADDVAPVTHSTQPVIPDFESEDQPTIGAVELTDLTPQNIFGTLVDPLYLALMTLFGYLSAYIPGLNAIKNTWLRVFAVALVIGLGFFLWKGQFAKIAITYIISSGLYVTIFRNIVKTPKPA
jgi:hypothetical protein